MPTPIILNLADGPQHRASCARIVRECPTCGHWKTTKNSVRAERTPLGSNYTLLDSGVYILADRDRWSQQAVDLTKGTAREVTRGEVSRCISPVHDDLDDL